MKNSAITYTELLEEGLITLMERKVADFVKLHGPCNGNDIDEIIPGGHKRLASLERKGLIVAIGNERDIRTKRLNTMYKAVANPSVQRVMFKETKRSKKDLEKLLAQYPQKMSALYDAAFKHGVEIAVQTMVSPVYSDQYAFIISEILEASR